MQDMCMYRYEMIRTYAFFLQMTAHRHLNSDEKNRSTTHALFGPPKPAAFVPGCRPLQHRDKETQKLSVGPGSHIVSVSGEHG